MLSATMSGYSARYRGNPRAMTAARRAVTDFAQVCGFEPADLADISSAVGEALSNAATHGHGDYISVSCSFDDGSLHVEIQDSGPGFSTEEEIVREPSEIGGHGFGILIMRRLMDGVRYSEGGRKVTLIKRLPVTAALSLPASVTRRPDGRLGRPRRRFSGRELR